MPERHPKVPHMRLRDKSVIFGVPNAKKGNCTCLKWAKHARVKAGGSRMNDSVL